MRVESSVLTRPLIFGDSRKLYQLLKEASRGETHASDTLLDRSGTIISSRDRHIDRWKEFFFGVLNHESPPRSDFSPDVPIGVEPFACSDGVTSAEEVQIVIQQQKNGKDPGEDGKPPKMLKCCPDVAVPWLPQVVQEVLELETMPDDWSGAVIIPFFKKGDKRQRSNYRGICLIDIAAVRYNLAATLSNDT